MALQVEAEFVSKMHTRNELGGRSGSKGGGL